MPSVVSLTLGGDIDLRVTLPARFKTETSDVQLFSDVPTALRIQVSAFQASECEASCIVVLTVHGIYVLKRDQGMLVSDMLLIMNHNKSIRRSFLAGILRQKHEDDARCRNAVLALDYHNAPDDLRLLDSVRFHVSDSEISFARCPYHPETCH